MHKCTKSEPSFKQLMSGLSESVKNIVGELREYSELVVFDNVGWEKNSRKYSNWYCVGDILEQQNKITWPRKLLGENKTRY